MGVSNDSLQLGLVAAIGWLIWCRLMGNSDGFVQGGLSALAIVCLTFALEPVAKSEPIAPRNWIFGATALLLFVVGVFWPRLQGSLGEPFTNGVRLVASDYRLWFVLVVLVLGWGMISSVIATRQRDNTAQIIQRDIVPFRRALEKWVIPRRLTPEQTQKIGEYLRRFPPHTVYFEIAAHDEEAAGLASDLQRAMGVRGGGGWTILGTAYVENLPEGVRSNYQYTQATSQREDDPRNPRPETLFNQAMQIANIRLSGSGGGSGQNVTEDRFTIVVGPRRRDTGANFEQWPFGETDGR